MHDAAPPPLHPHPSARTLPVSWYRRSTGRAALCMLLLAGTLGACSKQSPAPAATEAFSALFQRMEAQPSGEITE